MAAGKGRFVWPVRGQILSAFGVQDVDRRNDGVDIKSPMGTSVHAAAAGEVVYAGDQVPGFGNLVLVKHADGWVTAYAHLARVDVKMRETVAQDQEIGEVGQTGGVNEPQLHFEVRYAATPIEKARPVDPLLVLPE
jgi:murein DD-endopeptidase MepM/ murein hydrolase activator NlpD